MKNKIYGFGIIGTGVISHFHANAIAAIENAELVGAYNINKTKADSFAAAHKCKSYETQDELLTDPSIDIVCICTPSGMHLEPALRSIESGKHCLIEKPLEITLSRCDQIIKASQSSGVKVGVVFPSRFYDISQLLKKSLDAGRFGKLVMGDAYVKWHRSGNYYRSAEWRGTWQFDGGGALMNQGIHAVDLLQWLMGPVKSVQASRANIFHTDIEVEDTVVALLKFCNGALGVLECSTAVFPGSDKRIEILGTAGSAVVEENSLVKWQFENELSDDNDIRNSFPVGNVAGGSSNPSGISFKWHQQQIEDFVYAIENNIDLMVDAIEGRKAVEIVLAVYESASTGNTVELC